MSKIKDTSTNQREILTTALKEILKGAKSEMSQKLERLGVLTDPSFEQLTYDITTDLLNIDSKHISSESKDLKNNLIDAYKLLNEFKIRYPNENRPSIVIALQIKFQALL